MTTNFGTVINRENWAAYIQEDPISFDTQVSPTLRASPSDRGLVIRHNTRNQRVFLPAIGALYILRDMQEVENWKNNGLIVGTPALSSGPDDKAAAEELLHTPFVRQHPEYVLSNPLRLTPEQSKELYGLLTENEQRLGELAEKDMIIAKQQVKDMFAKIAAYGRQKRLRSSR